MGIHSRLMRLSIDFTVFFFGYTNSAEPSFNVSTITEESQSRASDESDSNSEDLPSPQPLRRVEKYYKDLNMLNGLVKSNG